MSNLQIVFLAKKYTFFAKNVHNCFLLISTELLELLNEPLSEEKVWHSWYHNKVGSRAEPQCTVIPTRAGSGKDWCWDNYLHNIWAPLCTRPLHYSTQLYLFTSLQITNPPSLYSRLPPGPGVFFAQYTTHSQQSKQFLKNWEISWLPISSSPSRAQQQLQRHFIIVW